MRVARKKMPDRPRRYSEWPPQPYWPTFIEKLLLAIIDANPLAEGGGVSIDYAREARLNAALEALFGVERRRGAPRLYDLPALMEIGQAKLVKDSVTTLEDVIGIEEEFRTRAPSNRRAASSAQGHPNEQSESAKLERLRKAIRNPELKAYVEQVALFSFHVEEDDMFSDLMRISGILKRWNVDMSVNCRALGMASLWGEKQHD